MANILVGAALLLIVGIAARSVWKNAKSGGCSACGGSCCCPHCRDH